VGNALRKPFLLVLTMALMIVGLVFVFPMPLGKTLTPKEVNGIIWSETIWTKEESPYYVTGPLAIESGATLIIEPGATISLGGTYIQVNGTLIAKGTQSEPINIERGYYSDKGYIGYIVFTSVSKSWNEQTGSGSIMENVVFSPQSSGIEGDTSLNEVIVNESSPKIVDSIVSVTVNGGSPVLAGNSGDVLINDGSATVVYNDILTLRVGGTSLVSFNYVKYGITGSGSPTITNNNINLLGGTRYGEPPNSAVICLASTGSTVISNNTITGLEIPSGKDWVGRPKGPFNPSYGINIEGNSLISKNVISGCTNAGIFVSGNNANDKIIIENNTIACGTTAKGIIINSLEPPKIRYNNIQGGVSLNQNYPVLNTQPVQTTSNVNASYNWWGTTDTTAIDKSIYDINDDFNLGKVDYKPFLTAPNSKATPDSNVPASPTPTLTLSANPSPSVPELLPTVALASVLLVSALLFAVVKSKRGTAHFFRVS
jgi:hypothetical protein